MFRTISDVINRLEYEREATKKVFDALTEESLSQTVAEGHRTIGRIAWHVVQTYPDIMGKLGVPFDGIEEDSPMPSTLDEIKNAYATATEKTHSAVSLWKDEDLLKEDDLYSEMWKRGLTLLILFLHEAHHRGQLTVLMRQAGLKVPGFYGPAKEEWGQFGQDAPAV